MIQLARKLSLGMLFILAMFGVYSLIALLISKFPIRQGTVSMVSQESELETDSDTLSTSKAHRLPQIISNRGEGKAYIENKGSKTEDLLYVVYWENTDGSPTEDTILSPEQSFSISKCRMIAFSLPNTKSLSDNSHQSPTSVPAIIWNDSEFELWIFKEDGDGREYIDYMPPQNEDGAFSYQTGIHLGEIYRFLVVNPLSSYRFFSAIS